MQSNEYVYQYTMEFMGIPIRIFDRKEKRWLPLADLAKGMGYEDPKGLYQLVKRLKHLLKDEGHIRNAKDTDLFAELVVTVTTNKVELPLAVRGNKVETRGAKPGLMTNYEGLITILMKSDSPAGDKFVRWARVELIPAMLKRALKETELSGIPPEKQVKARLDMIHQRELYAAHLYENVPVFQATKAVKEVKALKEMYGDKAPADLDKLLEKAGRLYDIAIERKEGPSMFKALQKEGVA